MRKICPDDQNEISIMLEMCITYSSVQFSSILEAGPGCGPLFPDLGILGPIPETIRSLWKSDRITNFSSAHDFSIRSDSTNDPASIGSWSWAILLATWIGVRSENIITTIGHFISNITTVKVHKLPGNTYWNMVCLVSTVCIFSMTLFTYTYLSNMACPKRVASWPNTVCGHWTGHDALVSALMNDVATPPIVTSWIDIISLTFFIQSWPRNFNSKFPSEWFMSWFNWQ